MPPDPATDPGPVEFLTRALDACEASAARLDHVTADRDVDSEVLACPASRTEPLGDLPWGPENCDCGLQRRRDQINASVAAERVILAMHGPTRGMRLPGDDGPLVESDDPADLMYPAAAMLCRICGPGDSWEAERPRERYGELPCDTVRLLAWGHRHDISGWDDTWTPAGAR